MRRTVLVPTMLVAMSLAALLVLALTLAAPVAAQEEATARTDNDTQTVSKDKDAPSGESGQSVQEGGKQAEPAPVEEAGAPTEARATDSLQEAAVTIESNDGTVNRIEIAAADCAIEKGATVTVVDGNVNEQTFTDIGDVTAEGSANIEATEDQVLVTDIEDDLNPEFGTSNTGEVTDSSGITCGRAADEPVADEPVTDDAMAADELQELGCDELLLLFRAEGSAQQYRDASGLADADVRAQIELCLEEEIVEGTAADEDLPDTGGLSLIGLAVLGIVSAAACLSVIRGGRR